MRAWLMLALSILFNVAGNLLVKQFSATSEIRGISDYVALPFVLGLLCLAIYPIGKELNLRIQTELTHRRKKLATV